jgi:hypothetical protein
MVKEAKEKKKKSRPKGWKDRSLLVHIFTYITGLFVLIILTNLILIIFEFELF